MTVFVGTGGDDTVALQAALDASAGGVLEWRGVSQISATLLWDKPIKIDAKEATLIAQGCGGIRISPQAAANKMLWSLDGLTIVPSAVGGPGDGIHVDLNAGQWLSKFEMRRCKVASFGGFGFRQTKVNGSDGFFCSVIEDNTFNCGGGGLDLDGSGDSLIVARNIITGAGLGVRSISIPGAAHQVFRENNISAGAGAFVLSGANQTKILNNQVEAVAYTGSLGGMLYIAGRDCDVIGNNLNSHGNAAPIVIASGEYNCFDMNTVSVTGLGGKPHYRLLAGAGPGNSFPRTNRCRVDGVRVPVPWIENSSAAPQWFATN